MTRFRIFSLFFSVAIIWTVLSALFIVDETQQALVVQFGEPRNTISKPGLNFKYPFIQDVIYFEKRVLSFIPDEGEEAILNDQKRLKVDTYARFKIIDPLRFYQSVRNEVEARKQLDTIVDSALREELGQRGLSEILSDKRIEITSNIREAVNLKATSLGMEIIDIQIRRADYPEVTSQAIFARMISERERIAREFRATGEEEAQKIRAATDRDKTVILADAYKTSQQIRCEGEAKALDIYASSFSKDPKFYEFIRTLETFEKVIDDKTTLVLPGDSKLFKELVQ